MSKEELSVTKKAKRRISAAKRMRVHGRLPEMRGLIKQE
jgi:hypothetical protein